VRSIQVPGERCTPQACCWRPSSSGRYQQGKWEACLFPRVCLILCTVSARYLCTSPPLGVFRLGWLASLRPDRASLLSVTAVQCTIVSTRCIRRARADAPGLRLPAVPHCVCCAASTLVAGRLACRLRAVQAGVASARVGCWCGRAVCGLVLCSTVCSQHSDGPGCT